MPHRSNKGEDRNGNKRDGRKERRDRRNNKSSHAEHPLQQPVAVAFQVTAHRLNHSGQTGKQRAGDSKKSFPGENRKKHGNRRGTAKSRQHGQRPLAQGKRLGEHISQVVGKRKAENLPERKTVYRSVGNPAAFQNAGDHAKQIEHHDAYLLPEHRRSQARSNARSPTSSAPFLR